METPDAFLATARGFMESRVLLSAAELDVFTPLANRPMSSNDLAALLACDERGLTVLLDASVALGWLIKEQGAYRCPPETARWLSADSPETALPMILHSAHLWRTWSTLSPKVKELGPGEPLPVDQEARTKAFIGAMHVTARNRAAEVAAKVGAEGRTRLLDVGGASGTYSIAFVKQNPSLNATLFDLPNVVDMARSRIAEEALGDRISVIPGDFTRDPLPTEHDMVWLSAIIHMNGPEENLDLFRKCYDALVPGGRIVIRDHVMSDDKTWPQAGALFAINMLVATDFGSTYTFGEVRDGLMAAGFAQVTLLDSPGTMDGLIEAWKP